MTKKKSDHNAIRGEISEIVACLHFLSNGFAVFRNMIPRGPIDFVAVNLETGEAHFLDAKTVRSAAHKSRRRHTPEQEKLNVIFAYLSPNEADDLVKSYRINFVDAEGKDVKI